MQSSPVTAREGDLPPLGASPEDPPAATGAGVRRPPPLAPDKVERHRMVGWYDPGQLLRTGFEVIVSTIFGRHSDNRRLDGLRGFQYPLLDYRSRAYADAGGGFTFDFVADTGDGWNSTYAVAYAVSQRELATANHREPLPRGEVLIFGGDLVYPYPTRKWYEERLITPYRHAAGSDPQREVLAIPGNHDWYDSLVHFRQLFCFGGEFAGRNTRQCRSYFAARLPEGWWLFALDLQLTGDIDRLQFEFFAALAGDLPEGDRIVMLLPEPTWRCEWEEDRPADTSFTSLRHTLEEMLGDRLRVSVAGDLHHYMRHTSRDGRHKITCGTGGAFLHPTHHAATDPTGEFVHQQNADFPPADVSRKLTRDNLLFLLRNPLFGLVPACAYLLASWQNGLTVGECFGLERAVCIPEIGTHGLAEWWKVLLAGMHSALLSPTGAALYGLIFWGFLFFTKGPSRLFRYTVGAAHALTHVLAGFLVYWLSVYLVISVWDFTPKTMPQYLAAGTLIFVLSWIVGSVVLGLYLLIALNRLGQHANEAFSSLRIEDWKGFLRCRVEPGGRLVLRFIGLRKVPRKWTFDKGTQRFEPPPGTLVPEVIDTVTVER